MGFLQIGQGSDRVMSSRVQTLQIMEWPQGRIWASGTLTRQITHKSTYSSSTSPLRGAGEGRNWSAHLLLRSNAEFLVERPVLLLVLRGAVMGFKATGALERGGIGAGRITTGRGRFGRGRGFGWRLTGLYFWGNLVCIEGVEGVGVCYDST